MLEWSQRQNQTKPADAKEFIGIEWPVDAKKLASKEELANTEKPIDIEGLIIIYHKHQY